MHAPPDRSPQASHRTELKSGGLGIFILPAIALLVIVTLAISYPKSSIWIAQAVEAEFGIGGVAADTPVDTAQPGMVAPLRTVHAY